MGRVKNPWGLTRGLSDIACSRHSIDERPNSLSAYGGHVCHFKNLITSQVVESTSFPCSRVFDYWLIKTTQILLHTS